MPWITSAQSTIFTVDQTHSEKLKTYYHLLKPKASDSDFNPKSEHIFVITAHDWNERHSIFVYELTLGGGVGFGLKCS